MQAAIPDPADSIPGARVLVIDDSMITGTCAKRGLRLMIAQVW